MSAIILRKRPVIVLASCVALLLLLTAAYSHPRSSEYLAQGTTWVKEKINDAPKQIQDWVGPPESLPEPPPVKEEIFPLANEGRVPQVNPKFVVENPDLETPLFIGFGRNWFQLEQTVVSYLAAGWPAAQIIVVDNTGVMDSNDLHLLTYTNPWYLNTTRLSQLGVQLKRTPTLLTFAQLQNFFINYAVEQKWPWFFWSHMDVVVLPNEELDPFKSFHARALECLRETKDTEKWALKYFAYDWLTLVSTDAMKKVGGWDNQIPFYLTDCDMYERIRLNGFRTENCDAGFLFDTSSTLDDLAVLYPNPGEADKLNTERWHKLKDTLLAMQDSKQGNRDGRNTWQAAQRGGKGEPFWRNPQGFERAVAFWISRGREVYKMKWGYDDCDLEAKGRKAGDEWVYETLDRKYDYEKYGKEYRR